jgi:lipopolysaccharide/colanic/teichoic acid biosynthesis glycosyltransferase
MNGPYQKCLKRPLDMIVGALLLIALSPLLLCIAILVKVNLGRPVLFRQRRPGREGEPFFLYKFRTMTDERTTTGEMLPDSARLTRLGNFLRHSSMDELPELLNVVRGEMSLIGPRPLLMEYLERYTPDQARRHYVRPGITGWAQVNGRNAISWEEKFRYDVWYVDHCGLLLDVRILASTAIKILWRDGISARGCATIPAFTGVEETRPRPERALPKNS